MANTITVDQYIANLRIAARNAFRFGGAYDDNLVAVLSGAMDGIMGHGIAYEAAYAMTEEAVEAGYLMAKADEREAANEVIVAQYVEDARASVSPQTNAIDRLISRNPIRAFRATVAMGIVGAVGFVTLLVAPAFAGAPPVIYAGVDTAELVTLADGTETYLQQEYLECQDDPTILVYEDYSATCMTLDPHQHLRVLANRSAAIRNAK